MHIPALTGKHAKRWFYSSFLPESGMRIATWNVNSIRQRLDNMLAWLKERDPDIVCLQEIKCVDEAFPREAFEGLGYVQARFLEALVSTKTGVLRVVSLYLPNGNPPDTEKYAYKLKWMDRLIAFSRERLKLEEPFVLAGDYNVIPTAADARNPAAWTKDALFLPPTRERFRALTNLGLTDAIRAVSDGRDLYTFWDYQAGAWAKDDGIRIDHLLLSPQAADRLADAGIDRHVRAWDKPSDHVPVYIDLDIEAR
jgi:exodeoxyribonuclease-3